MNCSPVRKGDANTGCLIDKELDVIADVFKLDKSRDIYKQIKDCKSCDLQDSFVMEKIQDLLGYNLNTLIFKPTLHKDRFQWLNTGDIDTIMDQYMNFDNSFKYLGTFPSDITTLGYKLPKVKHYKKLAMVLNLDSHDKPGSHWVAVYIDYSKSKDNGVIEYFDSLGDIPTRDTKRVLKYLKRELGYTPKVLSKKFQIEDSECGIYCIYYIVSRLLGFTARGILTNVIRDKEMNGYRNVLYKKR